MYETLFQVARIENVATRIEQISVIARGNNADMQQMFDELYRVYTRPSSILCNQSFGSPNMGYFYFGEEWENMITFDEIGWIDDNGKHYYNN